MSDLFRVYRRAGPDGYPAEWHETIKYVVREQAGNRCLRCKHPYSAGQGQWSPCDSKCEHLGPIRFREIVSEEDWREVDVTPWGMPFDLYDEGPNGRTLRYEAQARWRILTVHHLNGVKLDCRWWNLAALCQRCHLTIQGKVRLERPWPYPHSEWFKPYAAGWYAHRYLRVNLDRAETLARLDELLDLERWPTLLDEVPTY